MQSMANMFDRKRAQQAFAVLGCLALLYFVAGATLHAHTDRQAGGPDTACHVCQALHMPALATAALHLVPEAQQVARHAALLWHAAPSDSFALDHAGRAPPAV